MIQETLAPSHRSSGSETLDVQALCEWQLRRVKSQLIQLRTVASEKKSIPRKVQRLPKPLRLLFSLSLKVWNFFYKDQYNFNERVLTTLEEIQATQKILTSQLTQNKARTNPYQVDQSAVLADFYLQLEKRFRGSYGLVKSRLEFYLDFLPESGVPFQVLDLGVGRGEWLDLVKAHGAKTFGVDINPDFAQQCLERGHTVYLADVLEHLQSLPEGSQDVVTAFHLIEHLPFPELLKLFFEVHRVLKQGGIFITETPNPESMLVATQSFYLDPTHIHPIPRALASFIYEYVGFENVETYPLHPNADRIISSTSVVADRLNAHFYGPQDYGVVGRKGTSP